MKTMHSDFYFYKYIRIDLQFFQDLVKFGKVKSANELFACCIS